MKSLPFNSLDQAISLTSYALNNGLFFFFVFLTFWACLFKCVTSVVQGPAVVLVWHRVR